MHWIRKNKMFLTFAMLLTLPIWGVPEFASANGFNFLVDKLGGLVDKSLGNVLVVIASFLQDALAFILQQLVKLFEFAVTFDNFFPEAVINGWRIVRDFANLFFSFILLFIAISTVLNIRPLQQYNAKNLLPKFIIIALLINFSRVIVALVIDISQLFVFQFYRAAIGSNATIGDKVLQFSKLGEITAGEEVSNFEYATLVFLIVFFLALLIGVFTWTTTILVVRLAVFWVLIVLAPAAFVAALIPPLQQYWKKWLDELQKQAVNGPVLLFFIWLSFTILESASDIASPEELEEIGFPDDVQSATNFFEEFHIFEYILVIIFLVIANKQAQRASDRVPSAAAGLTATVAGFGALGVGAYLGGRRQGFGGPERTDKEVRKRGRQAAGLAGTTPLGRPVRKAGRRTKERIQEGKLFKEKKGLRGGLNKVAQSALGGKEGDKKAQEQFEKETDIKDVEKKLKNNKSSSIDPEQFKQVEKAANEELENLKDESPEQLAQVFKKGNLAERTAAAKQASKTPGGLEAIQKEQGYGEGEAELSRLLNQEIESGADLTQVQKENPKVYGRLQNLRSTIERNKTDTLGESGATGISDSNAFFNNQVRGTTKKTERDVLIGRAQNQKTDTKYASYNSTKNDYELQTLPLFEQKRFKNASPKDKLKRIPKGTFTNLTDPQEKRNVFNSFIDQIPKSSLRDKDGDPKPDILEQATPEARDELEATLRDLGRGSDEKQQALYDLLIP